MLDVAVVLLTIIFGAAAVIGLSLLLVRVGFKARKKGYRGPLFPVLITVFPLLTLLVTLQSIIGLMDQGEPLEHMPDILIGPLVSLVLVGSTLISVLVAALVLFLLPVRKVRRGGRRRVRIPFLVLARVALVSAFVFPVLVVLTLGLTTTVYYTLYFTMSCAYLCYIGARRQRKPSLDEERQEDPRSPVLYIRPFDQERRYFAAPVGPQEIAAGPSFDQLFQQQRPLVTFGEYLGPSIRAELGPFVGLGDPADYLTPRGIAPAYHEDDDWKKEFETLAMGSQAIVAVAEAGISAELLWELEQLKEWGDHEKLFILTEPIDKVWKNRSRNLGNWILGIQQQTWEQLVTMAATKGYTFDADPGPGSVITFNSAAEQVVLIRNSRTPIGYVEAISRRLVRQDKA